MAVTIVSHPPYSPTLISASHPAVFKLSSNIYGTANVTQFRFLAEIVGGLIPLGTKYTVVSEDPNIGYIDIANTMREILLLSEESTTAGEELTKLTVPKRQKNLVRYNYFITIKEQYYLSGVFTENALSSVTIAASRGFSDDADYDWIYDNWYRYNGLANFLPYSGKSKLVYPIRTDAAGWNPAANYMNVQVWRYPGAVQIGDFWFDRTLLDYRGVVYVPIYYVGETDTDTFTHIRINSEISVINGSGEVLQEWLQIDRNVTTCVDEETILMFKDRFFNWSFMSFTKKFRTTINTQPQQAEGVDGRFRYNVDSSDTILLNTDWCEEIWNDLFRDLIGTDACFLVDGATGDLEKVTIVQNSFRIKTGRNDGLIQYSIQIRKALDNFKP